jgi:hypothetical protein
MRLALAFAVVVVGGGVAVAQEQQARLVVESEGAPQSLGVAGESGRMCTTPCTLWVAPGVVPLVAAGDGLRSSVTRVLVPPDGLEVHLRAPTTSRFARGFLLVVLGSAAVVAGTVLVSVGESGSRVPHALLAGELTMAGGVLITGGGIVTLSLNQAGVGWQRTLGADQGTQSRW